ncbi:MULTISPECIES: hypothetical protein [unclassified Streptomyces]|uniref:hypothetical protein n=1 Tax=unclassified Streptomyces TaxID=2593676 RepID=UPI0022597ACA|nr:MULTISPECIES: hypothetical protein [unclassified Streptomyces]MCX5053524.1 hypothetical protein [Streptomyces sp. NBC_00474]
MHALTGAPPDHPRASPTGESGVVPPGRKPADGDHPRPPGRAPGPGRATSEAVRELAAAHRIDLDSSIAYGDHVSDAPLLSLTGRAVIVGDDQDLRRLAAHHGWDRLPKAPAPPAVPLPDPDPVPPGAML